MAELQTDRRRFLNTASALTALGGFDFIAQLPRVSAEEARAGVVRLDASIESLVRLIEESPRSELLERVANRVQGGLPYRDVVAALMLAGVRNVQPRPSVGFKFHCVLVVHSCHLASLCGPDEDRWLPIFWALDYFKSSQADEARRSGWKMSPVNESLTPSAERAPAMFVEAMEQWDVEKADAATAGLVRTAGATKVFNLFARFAARDYRSIGHKAIYLANGWRTLQVIGWRHAEPVLRSLAFALLNHNGEPNPADSDLGPDRPWRQHAQRLDRIPPAWLSGKLDNQTPNSLFAAFRQETPGDAAAVAVDALSRGVGPQSIWDGVFVGAGELLMRQPGIIGLHGLTTANAMAYIWRNASDDSLRRRLLLQACAFNPMFRDSAKGRGALGSQKIDTLEPADVPGAGEEAIAEILQDISGNRMRAAAKTQGFLAAGGDAHQLVAAARRLLFVKGRDAHDYKFASAVLEDYAHVSPEWRDRFLATAVFHLRGAEHPDSGLLSRTRKALSS